MSDYSEVKLSSRAANREARRILVTGLVVSAVLLAPPRPDGRVAIFIGVLALTITGAALARLKRRRTALELLLSLRAFPPEEASRRFHDLWSAWLVRTTTWSFCFFLTIAAAVGLWAGPELLVCWPIIGGWLSSIGSEWVDRLVAPAALMLGTTLVFVPLWIYACVLGPNRVMRDIVTETSFFGLAFVVVGALLGALGGMLYGDPLAGAAVGWLADSLPTSLTGVNFEALYPVLCEGGCWFRP